MKKSTPMTKSPTHQTDSNPFTAYRDPETGRWHVVMPTKSEASHSDDQGNQAASS